MWILNSWYAQSSQQWMPVFIPLTMERHMGPQQSPFTRSSLCEWHTRWDWKTLMQWLLVLLSDFCGMVLVHVPCVLPLCDLSCEFYGRRLWPSCLASEFCMSSRTHMHHTAESPLSRQGWPCVEYLSECCYSLGHAKEILINRSGWWLEGTLLTGWLQ